MRLRQALFAAPFWLAVGGQAVAVNFDEMLSDPALEARAQTISRELRCVVCQNQSIDDSAAPIARDMRLLVRERLLAGDTDAEVMEFFVSRYGNYVLLKPPLQPDTWLLWFGPLIAAVLTFVGFGWALGQKNNNNAAKAGPYTGEERRRLETLHD